MKKLSNGDILLDDLVGLEVVAVVLDGSAELLIGDRTDPIRLRTGRAFEVTDRGGRGAIVTFSRPSREPVQGLDLLAALAGARVTGGRAVADGLLMEFDTGSALHMGAHGGWLISGPAGSVWWSAGPQMMPPPPADREFHLDELVNQKVVSITLDVSVQILFGEVRGPGGTLRIEIVPFEVIDPDGTRTAVVFTPAFLYAYRPPQGLDRLMALAGTFVTAGVGHADGSLDLELDNGMALHASWDENYEAWSLSSRAGVLVSPPGGGL